MRLRPYSAACAQRVAPRVTGCVLQRARASRRAASTSYGGGVATSAASAAARPAAPADAPAGPPTDPPAAPTAGGAAAAGPAASGGSPGDSPVALSFRDGASAADPAPPDEPLVILSCTPPWLSPPERGGAMRTSCAPPAAPCAEPASAGALLSQAELPAAVLGPAGPACSRPPAAPAGPGVRCACDAAAGPAALAGAAADRTVLPGSAATHGPRAGASWAPGRAPPYAHRPSLASAGAAAGRRGGRAPGQGGAGRARRGRPPGARRGGVAVRRRAGGRRHGQRVRPGLLQPEEPARHALAAARGAAQRHAA